MPEGNNIKKSFDFRGEDTEDDEAVEPLPVDYGSAAENFRGLNDAQINQLSKKGIAKW